MLGIRTGSPDTPERLQHFLPQAGYGQGEVLVSPIQIARLAAAIADDGKIPIVQFVNGRQESSTPRPQLLSAEAASTLGKAMRPGGHRRHGSESYDVAGTDSGQDKYCGGEGRRRLDCRLRPVRTKRPVGA